MKNPSPDAMLAQWHRNAIPQKWLLPGDFLNESQSQNAESFECVKSTTNYLRISETESTKVLKLRQVDDYDTPINYVPPEFRNETVRILKDWDRATCSSCYGNGNRACSSCGGDGEVTCPPEVNCSTCGGRGQVKRNCSDCGGSGTVSEKVRQLATIVETERGRAPVYRDVEERKTCPGCRGSGGDQVSCSGCRGGKVTCRKCNGSGKVTCSKCSGSGVIPCRACGAVGAVANAQIITRKFTHDVEFEHEITGLPRNQFKNDLNPGHFKRLTGRLLVDGQDQIPASSDIVRQRLTVESYEVHSAEFAYKTHPFILNLVRGDGDLEKYSASRLPFSKARMAIAGGIGVAIVVVLAIAILFLA